MLILKASNFSTVFFFLLSLAVNVYGMTYYISPDGDDYGNNGVYDTPWKTLSYAMKQMQSGDTLIVKDGVYRGEENAINNNSFPPYGSANAWTIIKAEHPGAAIFDGQTNTSMFWTNKGDMTDLYWQFEGLIWKDSGVQILNARYVKFFYCGSSGAGNGKGANFCAGRNAEYFLFENCYAWGRGRYKFEAYQSKYIIFRQCVARLDDEDAGGEPVGLFSMYSVTDGEVQNCIGIDSDQPKLWHNILQRAGTFVVPSTDMDAERINFVGCIALNNQLGGLCVTGNESYKAKNITFVNCIIWDCNTDDGSCVNRDRGLNTQIRNCTFGDGKSDREPYYLSWDGIGYDNNTSIKNSIFYNIKGGHAVLDDVEYEDFNCFFGNSKNFSSTAKGKNTLLSVNPVYNAKTNILGGLKYICRVEEHSNLFKRGENGMNIGASALNLVGRSGSLWGDPGYNEIQNVSMWPFPNQDLIKLKMGEYVQGGISGKRGFCKDGTTLTKYIWEYLGNNLPLK